MDLRCPLPIRVLAALPLVAGLTVPAQASETVTFTYDALGRLVGSTTSGGVDNGLTISMTIDAADNRTTKIVANAPAGGLPDVSAIVLPINGYTIIPMITTP